MWEQTRTTFLDSLDRLVQTTARLLPGILAMLLILIASLALAALTLVVTRRVCARLEVDRRLRQWGMAAPASAGHLEPSRRIARVAAWAVVALGFLFGLSVLESSATSTLALRLLDYTGHALVGVVILAVGLAGSRALERSVLIGAVNMGLHSARLLGMGARWLLLVLASAMALEHLGIGGTILTAAFAILFGGIVLALALAVGLGAQGLVSRSLERKLQEQGERTNTPPPDSLHHL
jgi:hypothetical protein